MSKQPTSSPTPSKSDDMRTADVANGENPEVDDDATPHRTGRRQAQENVENDPPA